MSTDYEFRCVTCTDTGHRHVYGRDNWRDPEQLEKVLAIRDHLGAIGGVATNIYMDGWEPFGSMFPATFHFFAKHAGHEVHIFDEYGEDWTRRGEVCATCGHSRYRHRTRDARDLLCYECYGSTPETARHGFRAMV